MEAGSLSPGVNFFVLLISDPEMFLIVEAPQPRTAFQCLIVPAEDIDFVEIGHRAMECYPTGL